MSDKRMVLLLAMAACSRAPQPALHARAQVEEPPDTVAEGTVRVVGPQETAQVVLTGAAGDVGLIGPLAAELRPLFGARVRVSGKGRNNPAAMPRRAVDVSDYEILEVDAQRPFVGIIVRRDDRLWLAGRDTLELVGVPPDLDAKVGAKVFVIGSPEAGRLRIKSYGVIREPGK